MNKQERFNRRRVEFFKREPLHETIAQCQKRLTINEQLLFFTSLVSGQVTHTQGYQLQLFKLIYGIVTNIQVHPYILKSASLFFKQY